MWLGWCCLWRCCGCKISTCEVKIVSIWCCYTCDICITKHSLQHVWCTIMYINCIIGISYTPINYYQSIYQSISKCPLVNVHTSLLNKLPSRNTGLIYPAIKCWIYHDLPMKNRGFWSSDRRHAAGADLSEGSARHSQRLLRLAAGWQRGRSISDWRKSEMSEILEIDIISIIWKIHYIYIYNYIYILYDYDYVMYIYIYV